MNARTYATFDCGVQILFIKRRQMCSIYGGIMHCVVVKSFANVFACAILVAQAIIASKVMVK